MVTVSPATGTDKPPQVAVLFQLPVNAPVLAAALADDTPNNKNVTARRGRMNVLFVVVFIMFWKQLLTLFAIYKLHEGCNPRLDE
jgi:hypothetical protein